jgi:iron complex outermembrane receptor protein
LSAIVNKGKFGFTCRNTLFGNTGSATIADPDTLYESFSSKIITDVSISYAPKPWLTITAGANNIFDVYPDRLQHYYDTGDGISIYSDGASPFGYNGGYYFMSMAFNWLPQK